MCERACQVHFILCLFVNRWRYSISIFTLYLCIFFINSIRSQRDVRCGLSSFTFYSFLLCFFLSSLHKQHVQQKKSNAPKRNNTFSIYKTNMNDEAAQLTNATNDDMHIEFWCLSENCGENNLVRELFELNKWSGVLSKWKQRERNRKKCVPCAIWNDANQQYMQVVFANFQSKRGCAIIK